MFCRLQSKSHPLLRLSHKNIDADAINSCWHQFKAHQSGNRPLAGDDLADEKEVHVEGLRFA